MDEGRKQFTFYRSYYEAVMALPRASRYGVLAAIIEFGLLGKEPEGLRPAQMAAFLMARPNLANGRKKALAGKAGGCAYSGGTSKAEKEKEIETELKAETEGNSPERGFEEFWELYPVKLDRREARVAWEQVTEPGKVMDGLRLWLRSPQWQKEGGRYVPRAGRFLQGKHYLHPPREAVPKGASGVLGQAELEAIRRMMDEEG